MGIFSFPKVQKREFKYRPRFYDADKEALREKIRRAENKHEVTDTEMMRARISSQFDSYRLSTRNGSRKSFFNANIRLLMILGALLLTAYVLWSRYMPLFMRFLFPDQEF